MVGSCGGYGRGVGPGSIRRLCPGVLGMLALLLAVVSGVAFIAFMSVSGQIPKALAFRPNPLFDAYIEAPLASGLFGAAAVVVAILAMSRAGGPVLGAIVGAIVGAALFLGLMVIVAHVEFSLAPPPSDWVDAPIFPALALTPPAIAMAALGVGTAAVLAVLKGASGYRPAIAAMTIGGAVGFYWLLDLAFSFYAD